MTRHGFFPQKKESKNSAKKMLEEKVLLMGMKFTKKDYPRLYGTFYAIGVNTVVWVDGEDKIEIDLPDIAKQADMSKIEPAKRPLLNPTLELSGIYFMQELRRPVEKDQHGNLRELEDRIIDGRPLYEWVGEKVAQWGESHMGNEYSYVGAVVGATYPEMGKNSP